MAMRARLLPWVGLAALVLLFPFVSSSYLLQVACVGGVYAILILGYDFVLGRAGQLSLGHAAFYGIGAYTSALLSVNWSVPFWLALPAAAVAAGCAGLLVGIPTLRLRGHYLAMGTLAFGEIAALILLRWREGTRGVDGIPGIAPPALGPLVFDSTISYYFLLVFFVALMAWGAERIHHSRYGRALVAIRTGEVAAEVAGIDASRVKVLAFVLSAVYAGVAGSLYAHLFSYISPETFGVEQSIVILTMLLVGGAGSTAGAILGALLLTFLPEWLRFLKEYYVLLYGVGIVLLMAFMPFGIAGLARGLRPRLRIPWSLRRRA